MKWLLILLLGVLVFLQYKLWVDKQGVAQVVRLKGEVEQLSQQNVVLNKENKILQTRVDNYRVGASGFEERAREDLGMVKSGEVFYQIVPKRSASVSK